MAVNKKVFLRLAVSLGISFFLVILFLILLGSKTYHILEGKTYDLRFTLRANHPVNVPVLHIDVDDHSLEKLGRWPWPRSYHAKLVDTLTECGAKAILFDVLFTEKLSDRPEDDIVFSQAIASSGRVYLPFFFREDKIPPSPEMKALLLKDIALSPEDIAVTLKADKAVMRQKVPLAKRFIIDEVVTGLLVKNPDMSLEEVFKAIEDSRGWFLFSAEENYIRENFQDLKLERMFINKFGLTFSKRPDSRLIKEYQTLSVPIRDYIDSIKGSGYINAERDFDGVMRRIPLFTSCGDRIFPQLSVRVLMDIMEVKDVAIKSKSVIFKNAHIGGKVKNIRVPVDENGNMLINWTSRWKASFQHIPYYLVVQLQDVRAQLRAQTDAVQEQASSQDEAMINLMKKDEKDLKEKLTSYVKDKICLVGLTATGTQDLGAVPFETSYPMVGTHSNLIYTILKEDFIRRVGLPWHIFIFLLTALIISFSSLLRLWKSVLINFCYAGGYFFAACWLFNAFGMWIDMVGTLSIVTFGFSAITSFRFFTEEKEKLWIKQAFSFYLSKEVINEMMNDPEKLKLGGERRIITVLFSDVRGFTSFSESHEPEEVVAMLNEVLTRQVEIVFKYNGTLDKFVGDELMAFYGAPGEIHKNDHALVAVRTAVEIQAKMKELQKHWVEIKKQSLQIGIGINTGDMVVGNMGSMERMDYTVIGDNVNLAARICSAASKDEILISESTYEQAKEHIEVEKLEPISVKGKAKPINIYRVTGMK